MTTKTQPRRTRAVVFDLDGTLCDSAPDLARAVNALLEMHGLEAYDVSEVRRFIGHGVRRLVARAFASRGHDLSAEELDERVSAFEDLYIGAIAVATRLYPGALELLRDLRRSGVKTGICTNKAESLTNALLAELGVSSLFDAVVGGGPAFKAKPAPDMLIETMRRLDAKPADTIMIGDSESDVSCARNAGVRIIGVTYGYTDTPMRDLKPDLSLDSLDQVLRALS